MQLEKSPDIKSNQFSHWTHLLLFYTDFDAFFLPFNSFTRLLPLSLCSCISLKHWIFLSSIGFLYKIANRKMLCLNFVHDPWWCCRTWCKSFSNVLFFCSCCNLFAVKRFMEFLEFKNLTIASTVYVHSIWAIFGFAWLCILSKLRENVCMVEKTNRKWTLNDQ